MENGSPKMFVIDYNHTSIGPTDQEIQFLVFPIGENIKKLFIFFKQRSHLSFPGQLVCVAASAQPGRRFESAVMSKAKNFLSVFHIVEEL